LRPRAALGAYSMSRQVADALDALRNLGTPDQMHTLAQQVFFSQPAPRVNAHIHLPPNFSAFESVQQAVSLADQQGLTALGVSNYYDYQVYGDFVECARQHGIFPLFGTEIICMDDALRSAGLKINDPGNPGKIYLCGKGITRFDEMTPEAVRLLDVIRHNDSLRMEQMLARMSQVFTQRGLPTDIDSRAVVEMVVRRHGSDPRTVWLQERHLSQAFQEALFQQVPPQSRIEQLGRVLGAPTSAKGPEDSVAVQNDIRSCLMKAGRPAFVDETFIAFEDARRLVLELGGIPCYPVVADGASPIGDLEQTPERLIAELAERNIHAAEWVPIRNTVGLLSDYVRAMRRAGLAITGGTEHNTLDLIAMEPGCRDGRVPEDIRAIFWEGACVIAGHQFLCLHGQCGFVDDQGRPNPDFESAEQRIEAFARLGAAVIRQYQHRVKET
jgi:hypothetical protein